MYHRSCTGCTIGAVWVVLQGLYGLAADILGSARHRFPPDSSQHARLWRLFEQQHAFERAITERRLPDAEQALLHMAAVDHAEARLRSVPSCTTLVNVT